VPWRCRLQPPARPTQQRLPPHRPNDHCPETRAGIPHNLIFAWKTKVPHRLQLFLKKHCVRLFWISVSGVLNLDWSGFGEDCKMAHRR
jgi:hypothetical protein